MNRLTVAVALALSMVAMPALADCPGKPKHDQSVSIMPGDAAPIAAPTATA